MADSIQTMLDYRELTASYKAAPTLQGTPFTDEFFTSVTDTTADEVNFYVIGRSNSPAPGNTRGAAPRKLAGQGATRKQFSLFHSFNEHSVDMNSLRFLRSSDPAIQSVGREVVDGMMEDAGMRQKLLREVIIASIMTTGRVNIDIDGNVLVPSVHATTGAITDHADTVISADFQVADTHRGNLNGLITGLFDTTTTNIFKVLETVAQAALKAGGERPSMVYINSIHKSDLMQNTDFKEWAKLNNVRNDAVLNGGGVDNVWGWNFKFIEGYWTDAAGTQQAIMPTTKAIIAPPDGPWKRCKQGTEDVPTSLDIKGTLEEALSSLKQVAGMFAFAQISLVPILCANLYVGDNFGMGFANPNSIYMPTLFAA